MQRIDKILSEANVMSRSESKAAAKKGRIAVDGIVVRAGDTKVGDNAKITLDGMEVKREKFFYIMLNKPDGYVCSTDDPSAPTVLELLSDADKKRGLFPVGRLDKNTLGLLLISNDGGLAHKLLSPKKHVAKKYQFGCRNPLSQEAVSSLSEGVSIGDGIITKPSVIECTPAGTGGYITITEGKFHQIKRMFEAVGNKITYLKRTEFSVLTLDQELKEGEYRFLTDNEINALKI